MSSRSQCNTPVSDALVDEINSSQNELATLESDFTHSENTLPSEIHEATSEISQSVTTTAQDFELEFHKAINKLLENVRKENIFQKLMDELETLNFALTKKHAITVKEVNEIREEINEANKEMKDLQSEMLAIPRVKRQVHEIQNGYRIPQNENGKFEN